MANVSIRSYYGKSASAESIAKEVNVGPLTLYFSYTTVVGFHHASTGTVVRENNWGPTTGKHLNAIDDGDKKSRVSAEVFMQKLQPLLDRLEWREDSTTE